MTLFSYLHRAALALSAAGALVACAPSEIAQSVNDPYEKQNRDVHAFNKAVDRAFFRPIAEAGTINGKPNAVLRSVGNFSRNVDLPGMVINNLLQANPDDAIRNAMRFLINTTFGIGGIFDPATQWGLPEASTDFGETLHVWGVREGAYTELPFLGPSTSRDTLGLVVDFAMNPLSRIVPSPERFVMPASRVGEAVEFRAEFADVVDDVLYNSADSYAQSRLFYLQNRRFELGQTVAEDNVDPFALDTEGF